MKIRSTAAAAGAVLAAILASPAAQAACPIDDQIVFGGLDYGSAAFHTAVARTILEKGYECETDAIPGTTLVLNQGMARGDVDVLMEIWTANTAQAFLDAEKEGKVKRLGTTYPDAQEGWYVPRYVVEGADAAAPDLKSVEQLGNYKQLFEDPEDPERALPAAARKRPPKVHFVPPEDVYDFEKVGGPTRARRLEALQDRMAKGTQVRGPDTWLDENFDSLAEIIAINASLHSRLHLIQRTVAALFFFGGHVILHAALRHCAGAGRIFRDVDFVQLQLSKQIIGAGVGLDVVTTDFTRVLGTEAGQQGSKLQAGDIHHTGPGLNSLGAGSGPGLRAGLLTRDSRPTASEATEGVGGSGVHLGGYRQISASA